MTGPLNEDNGTGLPRLESTSPRGVADAMKAINGSLLIGIDAWGRSQATSFDIDHGHFLFRSHPALDLWVDMSHYGEIHHNRATQSKSAGLVHIVISA